MEELQALEAAGKQTSEVQNLNASLCVCGVLLLAAATSSRKLLLNTEAAVALTTVGGVGKSLRAVQRGSQRGLP